jgi:hypothetical protein
VIQTIRLDADFLARAAKAIREFGMALEDCRGTSLVERERLRDAAAALMRIVARVMIETE